METESGMVSAIFWEAGGMSRFGDLAFQFCRMNGVLEVGGGDDYTTVGMHKCY